MGDGQISFSDYAAKGSLDSKPKKLVEFINEMGVSQYEQIGNIIRKTSEYEQYNLNSEAIGRLTNSISVWLLGIGSEYEEYLNGLVRDN